MKINKILSFLGLNAEISDKLTADQVTKLEAAEEKLNQLEEGTLQLTNDNTALTEQVNSLTSAVSAHEATIAAHVATIATLEETIANGPAASTTKVVSDGDSFNNEDKPKEMTSWEAKAQKIRRK